MKPEQIKHLFPNASKSTIAVNSGGTEGADDKSGAGDGPLAASQAKESHPGKCAVSITSYRVRLADVEGLLGKWHLDALRYAGLIYDDTEEAITYQIRQKKVAKKTQEKTLIELTYSASGLGNNGI